MRTSTALFVSVLPVVTFAAGAWAQHYREERARNPDAVTIDRTIRIENRTSREVAALSIIRMGMLDWQMACAYSIGFDRRPRDEMFRACTVDLGIGEPKHLQRRQPANAKAALPAQGGGEKVG